MSYLPKAVVERGIKKRVRKDKLGRERIGYEAYFGTDPFTKFAVRITRASEDELRRDIKDFYLRHQAGGDAAVRLTPIEAIDAKAALDILHAAGLKISLADAVRCYVNGDAQKRQGDLRITVGAAYTEYYASKGEGADKNKTAATVGKWLKETGENVLLGNVAAKDVVEYLKRHYGDRKPKTYNSHLLYLKTFFNWCAKDERKYLAESPIRMIKPKEEPWEDPEYMKAADAEKLALRSF